MKLFHVTVEYEVVVLADDEQDAELEAPRYVHEDGGEPVVAVSEVTRREMLTEGWLTSHPYGDADAEYEDKTCDEIIKLLAEQAAEAKRIADFEARQVPLPLAKP